MKMQDQIDRLLSTDPNFGQYDVTINGQMVPSSIVLSADVEKREVWCRVSGGDDRPALEELKTGTVVISLRTEELDVPAAEEPVPYPYVVGAPLADDYSDEYSDDV
jgi:hypothetical protein